MVRLDFNDHGEVRSNARNVPRCSFRGKRWPTKLKRLFSVGKVPSFSKISAREIVDNAPGGFLFSSPLRSNRAQDKRSRERSAGAEKKLIFFMFDNSEQLNQSRFYICIYLYICIYRYVYVSIWIYTYIYLYTRSPYTTVSKTSSKLVAVVLVARRKNI